MSKQQPDPRLRPYATDRQWQVLTAVAAHGGNKARAGKALDMNASNVSRAVKVVLRRAAQHGYAPERDLTHETAEGFRLKGTSTLYRGDGSIQAQWSKTAVEGGDRADYAHVPDPKKVVKTSTMFDQTGAVTQQWVTERTKDAEREKLWDLLAKEMAAKLPRVAKIPGPKSVRPDLMACYPVGDHHLGMLAWDKETGVDYDMTIGERLLRGAIDHLLLATPACDRALIAFLGDFMHYDSFEAVTPTSRNMLDADGRYPKMVSTAIRCMRYVIERAAERHGHVHVIVEIGNHDLSSSIFLMACLANIYENNPRITVDTSPKHYHYAEFGKCLIGTHHGHGAKMDALPIIMATDQREAWGRTEHRYWFTGHVHHSSKKVVLDKSGDSAGCSIESFRVLAPTDAWASQKGYRSIRDMKAILLHREYGEIARHTVNPLMLGEAA